jgi:predicted translation initiation factor SUI1
VSFFPWQVICQICETARISSFDSFFNRAERAVAKRDEKTVLFLCTGNYYRSRFAEIYFNSVAMKMGLPWKAISRGLALERGVGNIGSMSALAIKALEAMWLRDAEAIARFPVQVKAEDMEQATFIVALKYAEHLPLLQERFPAWVEEVEFWHVDDAPEVLSLIEREVMGLTARLIGGGKRQEPPPEDAVKAPITTKPKKEASTNAAVVKVGREIKGRRGKGVTTVFDVPLDEAGLLELAATLKQKCGTGGTVKDRRIEIQGDQRERLVTVLEGMGFKVKRVGG